MVSLRGMTWDHIRGINPMNEATRQFTLKHPEVEISWDVRSLKDFEDFPIEILADQYDLLLIDHPFIGTGVEKNVLCPLNNYLPEPFLENQAQNTVGKSYESYTWHGEQWALAVDAATQVAVYREDLFKQLNLKVPKNWGEVNKLIQDLPVQYKVGMPLNPIHAYLSFLALCVNFGDEDFLKEDCFEQKAALESLQFLKELLPFLHPSSINNDPIQMSDSMSSKDEIVYVPLMYGYVPYAKKEYVHHPLSFSNIPSAHDVPKGGVLGGVGLAISAFSKYKVLAAEFLRLAASEDFQKGGCFESGGQPGHRKAWEDPVINEKANQFFKHTIDTLDHSYLRPRFPGYPSFQRKASEHIHEFLMSSGKNPIVVVNKLNELLMERKIRS